MELSLSPWNPKTLSVRKGIAKDEAVTFQPPRPADRGSHYDQWLHARHRIKIRLLAVCVPHNYRPGLAPCGPPSPRHPTHPQLLQAKVSTMPVATSILHPLFQPPLYLIRKRNWTLPFINADDNLYQEGGPVIHGHGSCVCRGRGGCNLSEVK
ncbi:hypothetical protein AVEN_29344-1 [Araneus ventricosus]|uniref:Uncharacterized protein n=1 Tax=Araneus ventricosus TaxID=182803 RepID=A0A4Y2IZ66_ARAVE|nr:hypothetical protein AVEN_29344-1 [Araneus ventricosus]